VYTQGRSGYTFGLVQLYWNTNVTFDARSQAWANFAETGPGFRLGLPFASYLTVDLLRGTHLRDRLTYTDLRAGIWYAFSH
jgi:hypothetical protein